MSLRITKAQAMAHQAKHGFLALADSPHTRGVVASTRRMNKTELEYSLILEAQKRSGEILRYEYEGITLRWAGIRYTPDFMVFPVESAQFMHKLKLIEIKGGFIGGHLERAVERFRHARTYWPEFQFELWQKTKTGWLQKL